MKGEKHWLKAISLPLVLASLVVFLTGCGSFDATDGSQTVDAMMTVMDQVQSVETSITLDIQGRFSSGVSIDSEPHTAAVTSTATVESSFSPMACHGQYYSSIQVDGAVTREERECYIVPDGILPSLYDAPKQSIYIIPGKSFEEDLGVKPSLADQIASATARTSEPCTYLISPVRLPNVER